MGSKAREIIRMDVDKLIAMLNKALAEEWLAYYQYWVGSKVVAGPMKDAVAAELIQHATEELGHADLVAARIIQLGGTPVLEPKLWYQLGGCGYDPPADPFVQIILEQNIKGEQCAITTYDEMIRTTRDTDIVTYNMASTILEQEVEHEEDLQGLLEDLHMLVTRLR